VERVDSDSEKASKSRRLSHYSYWMRRAFIGGVIILVLTFLVYYLSTVVSGFRHDLFSAMTIIFPLAGVASIGYGFYMRKKYQELSKSK
jgi:vacuolar-type H+-ATPase subunit I/STV1